MCQEVSPCRDLSHLNTMYFEEYVEFIVKTSDKISYIFTYADEAVYLQTSSHYMERQQVLQQTDSTHGGIPPTFGHAEILLYKRYGCVGFKKWFEDS